MTDKNTPQWLKEVLARGFKPEKIYHDFDKGFLSYIEAYDNKKHISPACRTYVLEGLPGAGKTTLLERFSKRSDVGIIKQILPCEPIYDQDMPSSFYLNSEELKTKEALNCDKEVCVLDRYYASTLGFYWAYDKINKTDEYKKVYNWYKNAVVNRKVWPPFTVFYIDIDSTVSLQRKNRRISKSKHNLWENVDFLGYLTDYYKFFYKDIEPNTDVKKIEGDFSIDNAEKIILEEIYKTRD